MSDAIKSRLVQNTEEAIDCGSFGVPWMKAVRANGEEACFWGFDHLGQVARFLGLERLNTSHL
jgi:2-hydroxychromene-2-carboxylate isomerase